MSSLLRRTKIVATLGPATDDPTVLRDMVEAGVDVVRLNFSHGQVADHARRVELVRRAEITQNTGEDWPEVALAVSTVRAARGEMHPIWTL